MDLHNRIHPEGAGDLALIRGLERSGVTLRWRVDMANSVLVCLWNAGSCVMAMCIEFQHDACAYLCPNLVVSMYQYVSFNEM